MFEIHPDESIILAVVAICWVTIAFIINTILQDYIRNTISKNVLSVMVQRISGIFLFGFVPVIFIVFVFRNHPSFYGFEMQNSVLTLIIVIVATLIIVPLSWITSRSKENLAIYPQIRENEWNISLLSLSAISWIAYLFAYEFMYRGFLLFSCWYAFGSWPAIAINTSIYSLTHLVKNKREGIGAIFVGTIFCLCVLYIGSLWIAFFIHVIMALTNEWFSIRAHPEMNFNIKQRIY